MIHYLTGEAGSRTVAFIGILIAFAATCLTMYKCMDLLPKDQGRDFAVDGKKSAGKPRGAGFLFVLVFIGAALLFAKPGREAFIYLILVGAAMLTGFLCGYPMGAKVTADLLRAEKISDREARYLLSFCNNTSPVFIINFIVWKTFGDERLMLPTLLILIGSPVLMSFIFRRIYLKGRHPFPEPSAALKEKKTRFDFSVLDSCMMNSFEAIVKVGGYIILFSVLLSLLEELSGQHSILMAAAPALEVTNGILLLSSSVSDPGLRYAAVLGLTSFGGLCSAAQTKCMLERTGLSVIPYIIQKLTTAAAASLLSFIYLALFSPFH